MTITEENKRRQYSRIEEVDGKRVVCIINPRSRRSWKKQAERMLRGQRP